MSSNVRELQNRSSRGLVVVVAQHSTNPTPTQHYTTQLRRNATMQRNATQWLNAVPPKVTHNTTKQNTTRHKHTIPIIPDRTRSPSATLQTCDALRSSNAKLELTAKPLFRRVVAALYHAVRRGYRRNGQPVPGRILHPHRCRSSSAEKALKGWSGWVSKSALERSDCGDAPLSHVTAHTRVFHNMRCTPIVERQTGTHGETSFSSCGSSAVSRRSARIQT